MANNSIQLSETSPYPGITMVQDANRAFQAVATGFAGPTDPAGNADAYMPWLDTANGLAKRRNAANTEWVIESQLFVPGVLVLPTAPASKLSDVIYVLDRDQHLRWQTIGTFTGYASAEVGKFDWGTTDTPRPFEELAIGQTIDGTLPKYQALIAWVIATGKLKASADWVAKEYFWADLGGGSYRMPDMRDQFIRATGTDADTAIARLLGSMQLDAIQNITGVFGDQVTSLSEASGAFSLSSQGTSSSPTGGLVPYSKKTFDASRVVRAKSETRSTNTALVPVVCL